MQQHICTLTLFLSLLACSDQHDNRHEHVVLNFYRDLRNDSIYYKTYTEDSAVIYRCAPTDLDLKSVEDYGEYIVDRNSAYSWYSTSSGSFLFQLDQADRPTFEVLGNSMYAKDKNHVYSSRHGVIPHADPKTFKLVSVETSESIVYGMDSVNYYFWDQIITDTLGFHKSLKQ